MAKEKSRLIYTHAALVSVQCRLTSVQTALAQVSVTPQAVSCKFTEHQSKSHTSFVLTYTRTSYIFIHPCWGRNVSHNNCISNSPVHLVHVNTGLNRTRQHSRSLLIIIWKRHKSCTKWIKRCWLYRNNNWCYFMILHSSLAQKFSLSQKVNATIVH